MAKETKKIAAAEETQSLIGQATDEQIATWKKMYGEVYQVTVKGHVCYVKPFDRATMKCALSLLKVKIDPAAGDSEMELDMEKIIEIGEVGLQNCFIGGSEAILQQDNLFIAAAMEVGQMFDLAESDLKKL